MIINTKSTKVMPVPKKMVNKLILASKLESWLELIKVGLSEAISNNQWIGVNDRDYYFIPEDGLIIANPCKIKMNTKGFVRLQGVKWTQMTEQIARKWFCERKSTNPIKNKDGSYIEYVDINNQKYKSEYVYCYDSKIHLCINDASKRSWSIEDADGVKIPIYILDEDENNNVLRFLISNELNIFKDEELKEIFSLFVQLINHAELGYIDEQKLFVFDDADYDLICDEIERMKIEFNPNDTQVIAEACLNNSRLAIIENVLLDCDKLRINMETYPEHILRDPESGHWELWEDSNSEVLVNLPNSWVARNPVYDALENKSGVIGIDFGTKSTVVTYRQSRADVLPMRIGSGQFSRVVSKNDYENPTVMELRNIEKFVEDYRQYKGRPYTCWEDLLISHEAAEQLKSEQSQGDTFASFFSELKQWASDKTRQVRLRDLQGHEMNIPSYLSLSEDDFDPIEIYAYYLGLFINNMVHKVYLRYKLSFPATVEKAVRDKILDSFTRGIKKSLPIQVLKDERCMKIFKVEQGASEPAAYAITALYGYGFEPEDGEKHYYGIFDFGGGTTDFDFGVWSSEEEEPENYDYQISHFGQGGDLYLGGENLLGILSYHVFIKNYDKLLKDKIVFIRPFGEKEVAGKDYLICQDSQYAHFNHKRMMERLRGVWEGKKEIRELCESGSITLPLFTMNGETMNNYSIEVDLNELDLLLENRIDKGVSQFFDALKNCFGVYENQKDIHDVDGINIFLAGNSSKSSIVYRIFKKYIDMYTAGLRERDGEEKEWFKIYPPLGTSVSDEILNGNLNPFVDDIISFVKRESEANSNASTQELLINSEEADLDVSELSKPTGKTGVAYGLLNNRVRVVQNETEEIGFRYYIGQNRKNKFYCVVDKDVRKYQEWIKFCTASREEFDIWFTQSATAPSNTLPISQIGVYSEPGFILEPSSEKAVYIRLVSPTEIEYVVASEEEIKQSSYKDDLIERVTLQEKK